DVQPRTDATRRAAYPKSQCGFRARSRHHSHFPYDQRVPTSDHRELSPDLPRRIVAFGYSPAPVLGKTAIETQDDDTAFQAAALLRESTAAGQTDREAQDRGASPVA